MNKAHEVEELLGIFPAIHWIDITGTDHSFGTFEDFTLNIVPHSSQSVPIKGHRSDFYWWSIEKKGLGLLATGPSNSSRAGKIVMQEQLREFLLHHQEALA